MTSQAQTATPPPAQEWAQDLKVMAFDLGGRVFALPLADRLNCPYPVVERVMIAPDIDDSSSRPYQLIHWDNRDVLVIHLHRLLQSQGSLPTPFMLLVRGSQGSHYYGIPVSEPPALITLPPDTIRPVPLAYRHLDPLRLARYMAVLPNTQRDRLRDHVPNPDVQSGELLVFLLEMGSLVRAAQGSERSLR